MKYILSDTIALRSWQGIPHAYYEKNRKFAKGLTRDEFLMLLRCNGKTELEEDDVLRSLLEKKLCRPAEDGDALTSWQRLKLCSNPYFPRMFWSVTDRCGSNCRYCYNAAGAESPVNEFSWEECRKLIQEAAECGVQTVKLSGGEPFLHPHFTEILREIRAAGMQVDRIYTSGENLTQEILDEIKNTEQPPVIKLSFDGLGCQDRCHGREGAEKEALEAIRLCVQNGIRVQAVMNLNRTNRDALLPTALFLSGTGIDALQITRTTESPRWKMCALNDSLEPEEYYDCLLRFTSDYLKSGAKMPVEIWKFLNLDPEKIKEDLKNKRKTADGNTERRETDSRAADDGETGSKYFERNFVCADNRNMISVSADGELYPCITMTGLFREKGISFGNVKKNGLQTYLQSGPYLTEVCRTLGDFKKENPECGSCGYFPSCGGGCPAIALAQTGSLRNRSLVQCVFYKNQIPERIKKIIEEMNL